MAPWGHLGVVLGALGPSWPILGPSWGHLGLSWGDLERVRGPPGAILNDFGRQKGAQREAFWEPKWDKNRSQNEVEI